MLTPTQGTDHYSHTEITRKQWKGKTTLMQYLSVIDVVHSIGRLSISEISGFPAGYDHNRIFKRN